METLGKELEVIIGQRCHIRKLAMRLAAGQCVKNPFSAEVIEDGGELIFVILELAGSQLPVRERVSKQPFFFAALEELLRLSGDPDYRAHFSSSHSFAQGARLGVGVKLPRVPVVFERKAKWRKCAEEAVDGVLRENYMEAKFLEEAKLGAMVDMPLLEAQAC